MLIGDNKNMQQQKINYTIINRYEVHKVFITPEGCKFCISSVTYVLTRIKIANGIGYILQLDGHERVTYKL